MQHRYGMDVRTIARWILRLMALAAIAAGLWGLLKPEPADWRPASTSSEVREWLLIALGAIYFVFDYRLKRRAEERADREEVRQVADRKRRGDDTH